MRCTSGIGLGIGDPNYFCVHILFSCNARREVIYWGCWNCPTPTQTGITEMAMEITYGNDKFDFDTLPEQSRKALATYGLAHFLGNVQASKVVSRIRTEVGSDAPREAISAWRKDHGEQVKTWEDECHSQACDELVKGTVGIRQGGPRLDPVEKRLRELLVIEATALLDGVGLKLPRAAKDGEPEPTIQFSNEDTRTRKQILDNLANGPTGAELRKHAERDVKAAQRLAQQATARAQGASDPTSLGI